MRAALILVVVAAVIVAAVWILIYNGLVRARQEVADAWATVDTELERRHSLVPRLVESVAVAAAHERTLLQHLATSNETAAATDHTAAARSQPEHQLTQAMRRVVALRERYPELNSQQNFFELQRELAITEDRLGAARRYYNFQVTDLNRRVQSFPSSVVARTAGVGEALYFDPD